MVIAAVRAGKLAEEEAKARWEVAKKATDAEDEDDIDKARI